MDKNKIRNFGWIISYVFGISFIVKEGDDEGGNRLFRTSPDYGILDRVWVVLTGLVEKEIYSINLFKIIYNKIYIIK